MAIFVQMDVAPFVATPSAPTVTPQGTTGAATWSYKVVCVAADGTETAASSAGSTATGNATLTGGNFNRITWSDPDNTVTTKIYRTVSGGTPSTLGLIGTVDAGTETFDDTGLAGDASVEATVNGTGYGKPVNCLQMLATKIVQYGGAFVSTNQLQGSVNGVDYFNIGTPVSTSGTTTAATTLVAYLRIRQTAFTSDDINVWLIGSKDSN